MSNSVLNFTSLLSLGPENSSFAKMAGDLLENIGLFVPTKDLQFTSKFNLHDIFKHWWLFYSWYISEDREHKSIIVSLIAITTWVVTHNPWAMPHKPWDTQI